MGEVDSKQSKNILVASWKEHAGLFWDLVNAGRQTFEGRAVSSYFLRFKRNPPLCSYNTAPSCGRSLESKVNVQVHSPKMRVNDGKCLKCFGLHMLLILRESK